MFLDDFAWPGGSTSFEGGRSLQFGFGFEGISTPAERAQVMGRAMGYLLR